jgi:peroxiredoxin
MRKVMMQVAIVVCLGISVCSFADVSASASLGSRGGENLAAPDFTLETAGGKTVSLKDFKGKGVILFFFASWCPYCRQKLPSLSKNYSRYQSENIQLLAINAGESKAKVSAFAAKEKLPFDILLDVDSKTSGAYDVVGIPTFVLISKDGRVVYEDNDLPHNYKELIEK